MIFKTLSILAALAALSFGLLYLFRQGRYLVLLRSRTLGTVLGIPVLVWCAWHGCIMLEGPLEQFHPIVWLLVPVTALLSFFFLDYTGGRAAGGFFILSANELIRSSFAADIALRPLYSIVCLALGIWGIWLVGKPWVARKLFEAAEKKPLIGRTAGGLLLLSALVLVILPFC